MRCEHDGMELWYGTPDAPAPHDEIQAGSKITMTIGVRPISASNKVEVQFRTNQGPTETVAAEWLWNDLSSKAQYFRAYLPAFRMGDMVEYTVICRCPGRQIPSADELKQCTMSFRITEAAIKPTSDLAAKETLPPRFDGPVTLGNTPILPNKGEAGTGVAPFGLNSMNAPLQPTQPSLKSPSGLGSIPHSNSVPSQTSPEEIFAVAGKVASRLRAGVGGLLVQIVDRNVGDAPYVLLAEAITASDGSFQATFTIADLQKRGKQRPDLQARAFAGQAFLGASEVRYNASNQETLNIVLTKNAASALPSEHETLTGTLAAHFQGNLRDLQETEDRQDVTYLANKTGWDARAVALAALADQFSQHRAGSADPKGNGEAGIQPAFYYALFRAGLPANPNMLYQADAQTVGRIWEKAIAQGVIPTALEKELPQAVQAFQSLSGAYALDSRAVAGTSTLKEMLNLTIDEKRHQQFADLYTQYRTDLPKFWDSVKQSFGENTAKRLQLDGQLGYLSLNNAPLISGLYNVEQKNPLASTLDLAQRGYYNAEKWSKLLDGAIAVPEQIPGGTLDEKRTNYANLLAAQVRLSFPTAAVAEMVRRDEVPLTTAADVRDGVYAFLTEHQGKFEIGMQPVEQYIARNNLQVADETVKQVKRLQRVYQITPSDQAMTGLLKRGIDAAYHIVRYDKDTFVQSFAADLGGAENAALTFDKSVQVHNAVLNITLSYLNARTAPAIGVHSDPSVLDPAPASVSDVIAYATLESLFGSMDFCACDHCRSILSPAAYLVDLLLFLQSDPDVWADFLKTWRQNHANAPYPFVDQNAWQKFQSDWNSQHPGQPLPNTEFSPFDVLMSRRPDIQYLPLTCENTNTALPYIDVVNETLEYFIANNSQKLSLNGYLGHNTNGAASEDLLTSPQFVMDSAYTTLRNERFSTPLPFHQPLENLRRYFNKFEVPLPLAMERLRKTDDLERGANPYSWRDILMEEIGLSRAEYEILTDSTAVPLWRMYGFPNGTSDVDVIAGLSNAKQFARRVGITYEDLVSILKTRFINPNSDLIPKLERLGVPFFKIKALKDGAISDAAFDALLPTGTLAPDPAEFGGDIKAWVKNDDNYARIMGLLTLAIPAGTWAASKAYAKGDCVRPKSPQAGSTVYYECTTPGTSAASEPTWPTVPGETSSDGPVVWTCRDASSCHSFDNLAFRYADPAKLAQNINAVEFIRLLRFIRLWKKLGWTIEQTDAAICALYREDLAPFAAGDVDTVAKLDTGFLTLLPRLGVLKRVMNALNLKLKRDLLPLLACWSEIGAHGEFALYRQMFLNPVILKRDSVFDDNGYGEFLSDATKKLADHAEALRSALNLTGEEYDRIVAALGYDANTPLTIPTISAIFRRGWLARKLKLSVRELLLLIQLTGLDPFTAPDPTNPAILRLISFVHALKERSLKSAAALYLIWNQDLSGKSAPAPEQIAELSRTLRSDFASIDEQFAAIEDSNGDLARARMTLVYGQETSDAFFALLDDTLAVDVAYTHTSAALDSAITAADEKIAYDDFRHRLLHSGLLTAVKRDALKQVPNVTNDFTTAVSALFDRGEQIKGLFFTRYPELKGSYDIAIAGPLADRHSAFLKAFQPELSWRRKRQQALQRLSAAAAVSLEFAQVWLDPTSEPYPLHAAGDQNRAALDDVLALETLGLAVQFFFRDTATGTVDLSVPAAANLDYTSGGSNPLPNPGSAISGIWSGQVETPEIGFYNFVIEADSTATVTMKLSGQAIALTQNGNVRRNTDPIELKPGTLYEIVLTVEKVKGTLRAQWETPKRAREVIPARYLYPPTILAPFSRTYIRFLKAASLALGLKLTANEIAYFATHSDYQIAGDGWFNALPVMGNSANPDQLLKPVQALLDYGRIKSEISPGDDRLLTVLKDPVTVTQSADSLLYTLTRWDTASLTAVLKQFGRNITDLSHPELLVRVYDALGLVRKMGIPASALIDAKTNDPTADIVRDFQGALRARYDDASWRDVVRPINDEMRSLQRDAMVAYILHQMRSRPESAHIIDTPDKLFEYFLMDVQMDPCMQTSRIRHALSSVQLFIERCLMNLEPRVSPAAINAKQWEWMKRYRVWEANRKVYLFPENWLEPELRDDKSPFFKEIESELLQSDITEERAATALLNYLSKLEEVAKLEPCGIYHIPADPDKRTGEINYVVARTAGAHRKYYYRRYEYGWTPWEQIKLDIEDNPVIPVVWKDRLLLFWLRMLITGPDTVETPFSKEGNLTALQASDINTNPPLVNVQAVLCWSEYYNGKWQATKTSDVSKPVQLCWHSFSDFDRSKLTLCSHETQDGHLIIFIIGHDMNIIGTIGFELYNTHSLPQRWGGPETLAPLDKIRRFETAQSKFSISYYEHIWTDTKPLYSHEVLTDPIGIATVQPNHDTSDIWDAPFFFDDLRNVFYVTTQEQQVLIPDFGGYGISDNSGIISAAQIPPLVVQPVPPITPKFWGDGGPIGPDPGIVEPAPIERFITEDAYIHQGIGTTAVVMYGDKKIGPSGAITNMQAGM
ncbi:hypothetical protein HYR54_15315 [Candidatus Acetothermia bacterium]|nr:hypothetical protein [Candidatus Acetothermia bacterium]